MLTAHGLWLGLGVGAEGVDLPRGWPIHHLPTVATRGCRKVFPVALDANIRMVVGLVIGPRNAHVHGDLTSGMDSFDVKWLIFVTCLTVCNMTIILYLTVLGEK